MSLCLMFHTVGLRSFPWSSPQVAEDIDPLRGKFEAIRALNREVVKFTDPRLADPRARQDLVCITFDDGYLDNWVHVAPLLEEFGFPATIFVSSEFIDPRDVVRPQVGDSRRDADHRPEDCCAGFLSWPEMRKLEAGGLVEIQSHAATHSRWACAPEIVEYWEPGSATRAGGPVHELWNRLVDRKPFYLTEAAAYEATLPYGLPVLKYERALVARRFLADIHDLQHTLTSFVAENGGANFFANRAAARKELDRLANGWIAAHGGTIPGRLETDEERSARIFDELKSSRDVLSHGLGKDINAVCWPEGGVDETVLQLAREVGFTHFTLPSSWHVAQQSGRYQDFVPRLSSIPRFLHKGRDLGNLTRTEFEWLLRWRSGSNSHGWLIRGAKAARLARSMVVPF